MEQVHTLLGLLGLTIFVVLVIVIAAAITALVVRISPTRDQHPKQTS
jgi:hypothetical protein